jgi:hypothetical protein
MEEDTLRGDDAEKLVFDALSKCRQPMFVIRGLKFTSSSPLLQSVLGKVLWKSLNITDCEFDFVIIHRKIGVLLLEVASRDRKSKCREDIRKLNKLKEIIEALLKVLSQTQDSVSNQANSLVESQTQVQNQLEVYKVYVAPNDKLSPNENAAYRLDKEALGDIEKWFELKFCGREFEDSQCEVLHKLCCVLVGQRTEITTATYDCIDKQEFLEQSYDKQNKKKRKRSVVSTREHPGLSLLKEQFKFLNQQQLAVWEGPRHQVMHGVAGSGKTILLQYKALECARKGEKVTVYLPTTKLLVKYREFFEKNNAQVTVTLFSNLLDFQHNQSCHIFVDECQLLLSETFGPRLDLVDVNENMYFWLAFDKMQVDQQNKYDSVNEGKYKESSLMKLIEAVESKWIEKGFEKTVLNTCVRCTTNIYLFIQEHMKYSKVTLVDGYPTINVGHNIPGEKVKVYVLERENNVLPIQISDIPPSATFCGVTKFTNKDERLGHCVDIIKTEMSKEDDSCAMLMNYNDSFSFAELMLLLKSKVGGVSFDDCVYSCEWKTVIVVLRPGEFLHNYLAVTRAICKLVVIYI